MVGAQKVYEEIRAPVERGKASVLRTAKHRCVWRIGRCRTLAMRNAMRVTARHSIGWKKRQTQPRAERGRPLSAFDACCDIETGSLALRI